MQESETRSFRAAPPSKLAISLFVSPVPESAGSFILLNHPLFVCGIILVMLAVTCLSPALSNKAESFYARRADSRNLANRLFGFFGWLGYQDEYAPDMRMYRQDIICERHNTDKTGTFGSKGYFAKYARGPIGLYNAASAAVSVVFTGIVYAFVCLKAWAGAFGVGAVTQYISAVTWLAGSVSSLIGTAGEMRNNASFLKLILEYLEIPDTMCQGSLPLKRKGDVHEIEFRGVSFQYPGSSDYQS